MNEHHHKMYHYEVAPPASCWDRIASELDASDMELTYPKTLRNLSVTPPETAWNNIATTLDESRKGPFLVSFLKFAAAAAIIGVLAWGGIRILSSPGKGNTPEVAVAPTTNNPVHNDLPAGRESADSATPSITTVAPEETAIADARNDAALEQSKGTYASLDVPLRSKIRNVSDFFFVPDGMPPGNTRGLDFNDLYTEPPVENPADRYFTLITPEGNIIRMSKKLGDLVCCVSGEEQDDDCVEQMKKWRQQLASPTHGHAGGFMDILGLLKSMQEDEL